jgi:hypothetical protein
LSIGERYEDTALLVVLMLVMTGDVIEADKVFAVSDLEIRRLILSIPPLPPTKDQDVAQQLSETTENYFGIPSKRVDTQHQLTRGFEDIVAFA